MRKYIGRGKVERKGIGEEMEKGGEGKGGE